MYRRSRPEHPAGYVKRLLRGAKPPHLAPVFSARGVSRPHLAGMCAPPVHSAYFPTPMRFGSLAWGPLAAVAVVSGPAAAGDAAAENLKTNLVDSHAHLGTQRQKLLHGSVPRFVEFAHVLGRRPPETPAG